MDLKTLTDLYRNHRESDLSGRYIPLEKIVPLIKKHQAIFEIKTIGVSVLGKDIQAIKIGNGPKRILMWSQMHGNESTTTKAIFDLCNTFAGPMSQSVRAIFEKCTIAIIPMLNPDGATAYTRTNAHKVDLNRDAQELSQPESKVLRTFFDAFQPHFCFNLHDQRTIFSAGSFKHPATVSFLAPAQDAACSVTETRKKAMEIIVKMHGHLHQLIPNQIGVFDDAFNINCVGDTFQSLNIPTVLFEAGHYADDYDREVVREFIYHSLMVGIDYIASTEITGIHYENYFSIPQNQKLFYDIIIRNAKVDGQTADIAIQFKELLVKDRVAFVPVVEKIADLSSFYAHKELDANHNPILTVDGLEIKKNYENDFVLLNNERFLLKP